MNNPRQSTPNEHDHRSPPGSAAGASDELLASRHLEEEVARARALLRRTRIISILAMLVVTGYMGAAVYTLQTRLLNPRAAAGAVTQYTSAFVQENGPALSKQLLQQVPPLVSRLPDMALDQLPRFRAHIEDQLEETLAVYAREMTPHLARNLDTFLVEHQQDVRQFLRDGRDPAVVKQLGAGFEEQFVTLLNTPGKDHRTAMDRLREGARALEYIDARLDRLAHAPNLTPEEKQLRRAVGLYLNTVDRIAHGPGSEG